MSDDEKKKIKFKIMHQFKLNPMSIKTEALKDYEIDLICNQFKEFNRNEVIDIMKIEMDKKDLKEISKIIYMEEIIKFIKKHNVKVLDANHCRKIAFLIDCSNSTILSNIRKLSESGVLKELNVTYDRRKIRNELNMNENKQISGRFYRVNLPTF